MSLASLRSRFAALLLILVTAFAQGAVRFDHAAGPLGGICTARGFAPAPADQERRDLRCAACLAVCAAAVDLVAVIDAPAVAPALTAADYAAPAVVAAGLQAVAAQARDPPRLV